MKTISGSVISSKPISLSKAASILKGFVYAETGASQAVSAYLRRASEAFNELVQLQRELKVGRSERKHKKSRLQIVDNENITEARKKPIKDETAVDRGRNLDLDEEQSLRYSEDLEGVDMNEEGRRSGRKKKKMESDDWSEVEEREGGVRVEIEEEKSEKRKKRKKVEVEDGGLGDSEERHGRKKKRRRHEGES